MTSTLSEDAFQVRLICELDTAVATRFSGTLGATTSGSVCVVALAVVDCAELFPAAS
jgi:hypothetical protein